MQPLFDIPDWVKSNGRAPLGLTPEALYSHSLTVGDVLGPCGGSSPDFIYSFRATN